MKKLGFSIPGSKTLPIRGDIYVPEGSGAFPVLIFCHGFKGFKDWGAFPYFFEKISSLGIICVSFNFSHNGIGQNPIEFTELENFKNNNLSLEVDDLLLLLRELRAGTILDRALFKSQAITLIGHSRGGSAVLRAASIDQGIKQVITLASISKVPPVSPETAASWREKGEHIVENMRTGQKMPMGLLMLEDLLSTKTAIEDACRKIYCPVHAIHGGNDTIVPPQAAIEISSWCKNGSYDIIPDADHVFGVRHPFVGTTPEFESVIKIISKIILASS